MWRDDESLRKWIAEHLAEQPAEDLDSLLASQHAEPISDSEVARILAKVRETAPGVGPAEKTAQHRTPFGAIFRIAAVVFLAFGAGFALLFFNRRTNEETPTPVK